MSQPPAPTPVPAPLLRGEVLDIEQACQRYGCHYHVFVSAVERGILPAAKEFFEDFQNTLVPFLNPKVYGRSILENSSFPDPSVVFESFIVGLPEVFQQTPFPTTGLPFSFIVTPPDVAEKLWIDEIVFVDKEGVLTAVVVNEISFP